MKFRNGFVSNSSSASFIISFSSLLSEKDILSIIEKSCLVELKNYQGDKFILDSFAKLDLTKKADYYELEQSTSMFNDWYDINCWKFIRALSENKLKGLKLIKILKTEEEYSNCNEESEFSKLPWNYNFKDEKEDALKTLREKDEEYYTYLYSIDSILEDDEKLDFSEILLSK